MARSNGFSCPPHPLQLLSWFALIGIAPASAALILGVLRFSWLFPIICILLLPLLTLTILVTAIDPAEKKIRDHLANVYGPSVEFDRTKGPVIDQSFYCQICELNVDPSSKHCRRCNKCVKEFDHHCIWLNTCIGGRNYRLFIAHLLITCLTTAGLVIVYGLIVTLWFWQPALFVLHYSGDPVLFSSVVINQWLWLSLSLTALLFFFVSCILTTHLLLFHIKLVKMGLTTYLFLIRDRRQVGCSTDASRAMRTAPSPAATQTAPSPAAMRTAPSPAATRTAPSPAATRTAPSPAAMRTAPSPAAAAVT